MNFCMLPTCNLEFANVSISMSLFFEVNAKFDENTLYGYLIGKKVPFLVVGNYVLNSWKKYGAKESWGIKMIRIVPIVLRKWTTTSRLSNEELTYVLVWDKLHGVPISAFTSDGLRCMDFARALIDIRDDRGLQDTMVISIPNLDGNSVTLHITLEMWSLSLIMMMNNVLKALLVIKELSRNDS
ncbi:hypothetical protein Tco_1287579 [Tanacetum coccineum]